MPDEPDIFDDEISKALGEAYDQLETAEPASPDTKTPPEKPGAPDAAAAAAAEASEPPEGKETGTDAAAAERGEDEDEPAGEDENGAEPPIPDLPTGWSDEDRAVWETLEPAARDVIARRSSEQNAAFTRGQQDTAEARHFRENFDKIIQPYRQDLDLNGYDPLQFTKALFSAHGMLVRDGPGGLAWIIDNYNIRAEDVIKHLLEHGKLTPETIGALAPAEEDDPLADLDDEMLSDTERRLIQSNRKMTQELKALRSQTTVPTKTPSAPADGQPPAQGANPFVPALNVLRTEKDASGNPTHPHLAEVGPTMTALITSGEATRHIAAEKHVAVDAITASDADAILRTAYRLAMRVHPIHGAEFVRREAEAVAAKTREAQTARQKARDTEAQRQAKAKEAQKASRAVASNGASGTAPADRPVRSIEEELSELYDQQMAGA